MLFDRVLTCAWSQWLSSFWSTCHRCSSFCFILVCCVIQWLWLIHMSNWHLSLVPFFSNSTSKPIICLIYWFKVAMFNSKIWQIILQTHYPLVSFTELIHQGTALLEFVFLLLQPLLFLQSDEVLQPLDFFGCLTLQIVVNHSQLW